MIVQNKQAWVIDDTPRLWSAHPSGDAVLLRKYPAPGREIDHDYPPTIELPMTEWRELITDASLADLSNPLGRDLQAKLDAMVWPS